MNVPLERPGSESKRTVSGLDALALDLGPRDSTNLRELRSTLEAARKAFSASFDSSMQVFGPPRDLPADGQPLPQLHESLGDGFSRLVAADLDGEYAASRIQAGQLDQRIGLPPQWHFCAYQKFLTTLTPLVLDKCRADAQCFLAYFDSPLKLAFFDMGLVLEGHLQAARLELPDIQWLVERLIHDMEDGLVLLDAGLQVLAINPAARDMLGLDGHAPLSCCDLGQIAFESDLKAMAYEVLETGTSQRFLVLKTQRGTRTRTLSVRLSAIRIDKPQGLIIRLHDQTDNLQAEGALARLRAVMNASDDAIYVIDYGAMRIAEVNASACGQLGFSRSELRQMSPQNIQPPEARGAYTLRCKEIMDTPSRYGQMETVHRNKNGSTFHVRVAMQGFRSGDREMLAAVASDVSKHKQAEQSLHLAQQALEASGNGIVITVRRRPGNPIIYVNPAFERMTGYSAAEVFGRNGRFLLGTEHSQSGADILRQAIEAGWEARAILRNYRKDGSLFWNELRIAPVRSADGTITHFVGVQNDITERKKIEEDLRHLATHDSLTGLPNRALLEDRLFIAASQAQRSGRHMAVLFVDLDHFKRVNDSLGHSVGDRLISTIARRLRTEVRGVDTVARVGGDKFVVVLTEVSSDSDISQITSNLLRAIGEPLLVGEHHVQVSASVGVSVYPRDDKDVSALLKNADTAMYWAKDAGRRGFRFYTPGMNDEDPGRSRLENDLRHALSRRQFHALYQPLVDLASDCVIGVEALVHWHHPEKGLLPPDEWLLAAEQTGLIETIGE